MCKGFSLLKIIGGNFEKVGFVRKLTIPGPAGEIPARLYLPGIGIWSNTHPTPKTGSILRSPR